jgi:hypothetical protein
VVNKKHSGSRGGSLPENFQGSVNRKGDFFYFRSVVVYLQAVKRRIRFLKPLYVQNAAKKLIQLAACKRH